MTYNILLVDDDEIILETYKTILEIEGYNVYTALHPYKALQIVKSQDIQLAILDYNLPQMTGAQLGHLIKKSQESTSIYFISGDPEIHKFASEANYKVDLVLSKPIDIEKLVYTIKTTLDDCSPISSVKEVVNTVKKQKPSQITRIMDKLTQKIFILNIHSVCF